MLNPDGVLICIEPAVELNQLFTRITGKANAEPTGGEVNYFTSAECKAQLDDLKRTRTFEYQSIGLIGKSIPIHHALSIVKK